MRRYDYLAAELFGYSYQHYQEKLDIHHIRFYKYMPNMVRALETGIKESWSNEKIAAKMGIEKEQVNEFKEDYFRIISIVDNNSTFKMFEEGIKATIETVFEGHTLSEEIKEQLIDQLMYRAKDFQFVLREEYDSIYSFEEE